MGSPFKDYESPSSRVFIAIRSSLLNTSVRVRPPGEIRSLQLGARTNPQERGRYVHSLFSGEMEREESYLAGEFKSPRQMGRYISPDFCRVALFIPLDPALTLVGNC
ncbi:MAG: hypothetical protein METHP_00220 [Methanoregula sp. SKADARSKE-2]|nr:MAG: hypothetical protein METHP_00220 [Methanoregula sp. SKADARSKE-2]